MKKTCPAHPLGTASIKTLLVRPPSFNLRKNSEVPKKDKKARKFILEAACQVPAGIAHLIGYLESLGYNKGHVLDLRDWSKNFSTKAEILRAVNTLKNFIRRKRIRMLGISAMDSGEIEAGAAFFSNIRKEFPELYIVIGGFYLEEDRIIQVLENRAEYDFIDALILGDGYIPMAKLIQRLDNGDNLNGIPNLFYRNHPKEKFRRPQSSYFWNPREIPPNPDFSGLIKSNERNVYLPIRIGGGCEWGRCVFCNHKNLASGYALATPEAIVDVIKKNVKKFPTHEKFILFHSGINARWMKNFADLLINEKLKITWRAVYPSLGRQYAEIPSIIEAMKKSGCELVYLGQESFSDRILSLMNKPHNKKLSKKILALYAKNGIQVRLQMIWGFPGETKKELEKTLRYLLRNSHLFGHALFQQIGIKKNTYMADHLEEFGIYDVREKAFLNSPRFYMNMDFKCSRRMTKSEAKKMIFETRKKINRIKGYNCIGII